MGKNITLDLSKLQREMVKKDGVAKTKQLQNRKVNLIEIAKNDETQDVKGQGFLKKIGIKKTVNRVSRQAQNQAKKEATKLAKEVQKRAKKEATQLAKEAKKEVLRLAKEAKQEGAGFLKKLGVKKRVNRGVKNVKKQAKNAGKKVLKKYAGDAAAFVAENGVRMASTAVKQIPVVGDVYSAIDDRYDIEDKLSKKARTAARKETKKQVSGLGFKKGSQEMKDKMAKIRGMKKNGGSFRSPGERRGGSFRSPNGGNLPETETASRIYGKGFSGISSQIPTVPRHPLYLKGKFAIRDNSTISGRGFLQ
jgi:hypothetical protein